MSEDKQLFDRLYKLLNAEQKEAVDAIDGPIMVIAGPGTGKTQILTLRIANILKKTDVPADAILALTFTNAAAANMRRRLVSIMGSEAYRVSIFTFHSFANHLIEHFPERFTNIAGFSNISDVDRIDIVRSLIDAGSYTLLRPLGDKYYYVSEVLRAIGRLKQEGLSPDLFNAWIQQEVDALQSRDDLKHSKGPHKGKTKSKYQKQLRMLSKLTELESVYRSYQKELARGRWYDFDDALLQVIDALDEHEDFLREVQEEYQYFLVDEHQDTNGAQNRILELLTSFFDSPNLFVVGDEKQAIFRFQGASLANFLYFEEMFKRVRRITLTTNYRSHQGVLDAAHSLIGHSAEGITAPLVSKAAVPTEDVSIKVFEFTADDEELLFLAESIQSKLEDGVPAHEIAVLYRQNSDVTSVADYFERLSIPFTIESGHGVMDDQDIRKLNLLMRALTDLDDNDALARTLFIDFLEIPIADAYEIIRRARAHSVPIFTLLTSSSDVELTEPDTVSRYAKHLTDWKTSAANEPFLLFFEQVVRESGLLESIQRSSFHTEKFDKLVRLFDELKAHVRRRPFYTLEDYSIYLRILEEHNLTLEAKSRQVPNTVKLMTAHKAKGLEFDYVFIIHAYDGHWGGKRMRSLLHLPTRAGKQVRLIDDVEDERRLFYVALTRARRDVFISYAAQAPDGRDRVPTQFIEEIREDLKTVTHGDSLGYANKRPPLFVERKGIHGSKKYLEFVREHFLERGLSATALNNYLVCPWRWFYQNFFYTQFVQSVHQVKGTAVHKALEEFFKKRESDRSVSLDFLVEQLRVHVERSDLESSVAERIVRESCDALRGWHDTWHDSWTERSINELTVRGVLLDDIRLSGKIDKLECLDEQCSLVRVVDYKTGKPKSRNEIEGITKTAKRHPGAGGYKRQLVFYKLLLDRFADGKYTMREGMIDFVEPNASGAYKRETFDILPEDTVTLEDTIRRVADEILNLQFWDRRCDDEHCKECAVRDVML